MSTVKATRASGRATISDVANIAKTGKTSVSRYLNGEQHLLSDDPQTAHRTGDPAARLPAKLRWRAA